LNAVEQAAANDALTGTTLGALSEYITSGSRDWSKYYADAGALFIRTQDINQNRLSLSEVAHVQLPPKVEGKRSLVRKGDLLITITGANVGKAAVVEQELPEAYVSQSVALVRLKDPSFAKFVQLQLIAKSGDKSALEAMAYGLGRPVLNLENIRSTPVVVASIHVRNEIVDEIEKQFSRLDEAVANLQRVKANLKRYKAAVLKAGVEGRLVPTEAELARRDGRSYETGAELLQRILDARRAKRTGKGRYREPPAPTATDLPELPDGWTWAALPELGELSRGKSKYRPRDDPKLYGGRYPFIQTGDVRRSDGTIREFTQTYSEFGLQQSRLWPAGTLCITIAANIAETGILTIPACFPDSVVGFLSEDAVTTGFVECFMRTSREELERFAPATAQKNINLAVLENVVVPLPPLAEQYRILAEVDRQLSIIRTLERVTNANLRRAERERQSILQDALRANGGR
jgi:restriction endonuclease S subunit